MSFIANNGMLLGARVGIDPILKENNVFYIDPTDSDTIFRDGGDLDFITDAFGGTWVADNEATTCDVVNDEIIFDGISSFLSFLNDADLAQNSWSFFLLLNPDEDRSFNGVLSNRTASNHGYRIQGYSDGTFNGNIWNGTFIDGTKIAVATSTYNVLSVKFVNNGSIWQIYVRLNKGPWDIVSGANNNTVIDATSALLLGRYDASNIDRWYKGKLKGVMAYFEDTPTSKADTITDFLTAKI